jgi:hypothetical protein
VGQSATEKLEEGGNGESFVVGQRERVASTYAPDPSGKLKKPKTTSATLGHTVPKVDRHRQGREKEKKNRGRAGVGGMAYLTTGRSSSGQRHDHRQTVDILSFFLLVSFPCVRTAAATNNSRGRNLPTAPHLLAGLQESARQKRAPTQKQADSGPSPRTFEEQAGN